MRSSPVGTWNCNGSGYTFTVPYPGSPNNPCGSGSGCSCTLSSLPGALLSKQTFVNDASELVGIGTSQPTSPLHISQANNTLLRLQSTSGGIGNTASIDFNTNNGNSTTARVSAIEMGSFNGALAFYTNNSSTQNSTTLSERMRIDNNGNIGIGTTTPNDLLSVYGTNQPSINIASNNGGIKLGVSTGANYPMFPVVSGDACIQTGANNLFIGNTAGGKSIKFLTSRASNNYQFVAMEIFGSGQIAIYNTNYGSKKAIGNYLLSVEGELYAQKVIVTSSFADYVFDENYNLKKLEEVEAHIKEYKRLPNMPSSSEIEENGMNLSDIIKLQMEKIEELTLHLIEHKKEISELKKLIKK